jgi:hypothetical protein
MPKTRMRRGWHKNERNATGDGEKKQRAEGEVEGEEASWAIHISSMKAAVRFRVDL